MIFNTSPHESRLLTPSGEAAVFEALTCQHPTIAQHAIRRRCADRVIELINGSVPTDEINVLDRDYFIHQITEQYGQ